MLESILASVLPASAVPAAALAGSVPALAGEPALGGWLHTMDPFAWRIQGELGIRWYGLSYLFGMMLGYLVLGWLCARRLFPIPRERLIDIVLYMVIGVFVGGRLGYVVFYQPDLLWSFHGGFPWWGVLRINEGGMASHGGMIGVIAGAWWASRGFSNADGSRIPGPHIMSTLDAAALVTPIGLGLGRLANFINAELLGRVVAQPGQPAPWWAVRFPQELTAGYSDVTLTPEQEFRLGALLSDYTVDAFEPVYVTVERITRRLSEGDVELAERIAPLLSARIPSQLLQAFAEGLVLLVVLWAVAAAPRKRGVISAVFMMTYGLLRMITEVWRLPDAHLIEAGTDTVLGLSRGQLLSAGMVLLGAVLLWFFQTRTDATEYNRSGGWRTGRAAPALVSNAEVRADHAV